MSWLLTAISGAILGKQVIDEKRRPVIPAENWGNKDLMYQDQVVNLISHEQFMRNLAAGKYKINPDVIVETFVFNKDTYSDKYKYYYAIRRRLDNGSCIKIVVEFCNDNKLNDEIDKALREVVGMVKAKCKFKPEKMSDGIKLIPIY